MKDNSYNNIVFSMASKAIAVIAYFGADILCARILPMQDYASWVYFTSVKTMLAYIAYFGLNTSTKVLVAQRTNEKERLKYLKVSIKIRTIVNLLFAILITALSQFLATRLDGQNQYSSFTDIFWFMGLLVLFESFFEFYKQLSYGLNDYKQLLQVTVIEFGSNIIVTFFFVMVLRNIYGALWACIISGIISLLACIFLLNKNYMCRAKNLNIADETVVWKQLFKYAFPLLACDIANLIALELDTGMIGLLSSKEQVVFYSIGKKLVSKAGHVNLAIAGGVMTSFAIINHDNYIEQKKRFKKYMIINLMASLGVCIGLLFFALCGVGLIYGKDYTGAKTVILLMVPYYCMFAVSSFLALFLDFQNKTTFRSVVSIISTGLNLVLNLVYIPRHGAIGAIIATLISQMVYFIFVCLSSIKIWRYKKCK